MQNHAWTRGLVISLILLFFGVSILPLVPIVKADVTWNVTVNFNEPGGQIDNLTFGEASDAHDGPPVDSYDVAKAPAPMVPYIRAYFRDNLPTPYSQIWRDYRQYPDTEKVWNLSVRWEPEDGETSTTITMSWDLAQVDDSEYTTITLCTNTGVVLKNMLVEISYTFTCPASVLQSFKIICTSSGNQPPVANPDSYHTNEDNSLTIPAPGMLGNDNDPENDPLTVVKQTEPSHGNVTVNSNGGFTYIPRINYYGSDLFTYQAYDGSLYSNVATVTIIIAAVNDAPVVDDISNQTIHEGSAFSTIALDTYVSDVDNPDTQMTWTYSGNIYLMVHIVDRIATITMPTSHWSGSEIITFQATDPGGLSDDDPALFTVTTQNAPPYIPSSPSPANGSTGRSVTTDLSWVGGDPDPGDVVKYDVYFGLSNPPSKKVANQTTTSYDPGTLSYSTTYYWMITAWDSAGYSTISPLFQFKTASPSSGGGEEPPQKPTNIKPVADISAGEPYQGFIDTAITFDGSKSYDPDGNITAWFWVFGDNTNGTGMTVTHSFSHPGTYIVSLTVTDDKGSTNIDSTTCIIKQPNRPPTIPLINGPTSGTKNILYPYTVVSTDADNDIMQYTFDWGDSMNQLSGFLPNGTSFSVNHSWNAAGRYSIRVIVTDTHTASTSNFTVYIDAVPLNGIGYLLDNDSDGIYDTFYSEGIQHFMPMQKTDNGYLLDYDGDGAWDYTYDSINGVTSYQKSSDISTTQMIISIVVIILLVVALVFSIIWKQKSRNHE